MSNIPSMSSGQSTEYSIIKKGAYPARLVKFVGFGMQEQQPYKGTPKAPAFKGLFLFELIGKTITATKGEETKELPAVIMASLNVFPGGSRGKTFELCEILDDTLSAVPGNLDWFKEQLDKTLIVTVGTYVSKKDQKERNCYNGASAMLEGMEVGAATVDLVFFDPYDGGEEMKQVYDKLLPWERKVIGEAVDAQHIPFAGMEVTAQDVPNEDADDGAY